MIRKTILPEHLTYCISNHTSRIGNEYTLVSVLSDVGKLIADADTIISLQPGQKVEYFEYPHWKDEVRRYIKVDNDKEEKTRS